MGGITIVMLTRISIRVMALGESIFTKATFQKIEVTIMFKQYLFIVNFLS